MEEPVTQVLQKRKKKNRLVILSNFVYLSLTQTVLELNV